MQNLKPVAVAVCKISNPSPSEWKEVTNLGPALSLRFVDPRSHSGSQVRYLFPFLPTIFLLNKCYFRLAESLLLTHLFWPTKTHRAVLVF